MADSYLDFVSKPHKKHICGQGTKKAIRTLSQAFCATAPNRASQEGACFDYLLESVSKTKKGKETILELSKLGYTFAFEEGNFGGYCSSDEKKIVINPKMPEAYQLSTMIHEGRHAIQHALSSDNFPSLIDLDVASHLKQRRAIEADAVAHEMAFVHQAKEVLPDVYAYTKQEPTAMFLAYEKEMERSNDERKAMQASFNAWFEDDYYRGFYDDWHKGSIKSLCERSKKNGWNDAFEKSLDTSEILNVCLYKGKPYISEESITKGLPSAISDKDKKEIFAMMEDYTQSVEGSKLDRSVLSMTSREVLLENRAQSKSQEMPKKRKQLSSSIVKDRQSGR